MRKIEAFKFDPGHDYDVALEIVAWANGVATKDGFVISTLEGDMLSHSRRLDHQGCSGRILPVQTRHFRSDVRGDQLIMKYRPG